MDLSGRTGQWIPPYLLPEIAHRHGTARPILRQLRTKFFRATKVSLKDKTSVASALLLSRELYASGAYSVLASSERQRLHAYVMGVYRTACGERFNSEDKLISDTQLLQIYELRAPYTTVRFSRLRLSVRLATKASFELLVLLHAARGDPRSWLNALLDDLKWLACCLPDASFTIISWFAFCREAPRQARLMIRKACDSSAAKSLTIAETSSAIRSLVQTYSCPCGWSGGSLAAYHAHRGKAHGLMHPANYYADASNMCRYCLVQFGSRGHLLTHLAQGSGLCLLNSVARSAPLAQSVLDELKEAESRTIADRICAGHHKHRAEVPPLRFFGPLWPLINTSGAVVDESSNAHPFGPRKRKYVRPCYDGCTCPDCMKAAVYTA